MNPFIHIRCEGPAPDWKTVTPPTRPRPKFWRVFASDRLGRAIGQVYTFRDYFPALILMRRMARDRGHLQFRRIVTPS